MQYVEYVVNTIEEMRFKRFFFKYYNTCIFLCLNILLYFFFLYILQIKILYNFGTIIWHNEMLKIVVFKRKQNLSRRIEKGLREFSFNLLVLKTVVCVA